MIYSLLIINKSGGLIYNREYNEGLSRLSSNDYLVLAGTFHGYHISHHPGPQRTNTDSCDRVHVITAQISPVPNSSGIEVLETDGFRLQCFQTHTGNSPGFVVPVNALGTKFLLITEPRQPNVDTVLRRIYEYYADYVMKNPFYQLEMPIRCEEFDRNLGAYAKSIP